MTCVFCEIIKKEAKAEIVYEDEKILGFKNIHPEAPVHLLFVPKKHIQWNDEFNEKDLELLSKLISAAKKVAAEIKINDAYKMIFNVGKTGHILHIHLHLLGGWENDAPLHNI
ncbi:MAG: HIT domain-containing protein [Candidatus Nealsonbacteria bacterium]|nr:HIT domain-containing protein [Candidatus Nealsonbacteria bacterium]